MKFPVDMMYIGNSRSEETETFVVRFTDYKKGEIVELINGYDGYGYKIGYYNDDWLRCDDKTTWKEFKRLPTNFFDDELFNIE